MLVTLQGEKIDQWTSSAHSQLHTWIKSGFSRPKSLYVVSCHHFETALLVTISLLDCGFLVTWQEIGNLDTIQLLSPPPNFFFNTDEAVNAFSDSTGLLHARRSAFESGKRSDNVCTVNPMHLTISMHNLYTVLFTFPKVLTRRIC